MATISFSGLTGIDFGTIADQLAQVDQSQLTPLQDAQTKAKNRQDLYTEILKSLTDVQTAATALAQPGSLVMTNSTTSDSDALAATSDNTAATGTYAVTVQQLATATRVTSGFSSGLGLSASVDPTKALNSTAAHTGTTFTAGYLTINGQQVTIDPATDSMNAVLSRINSTVTGVTASYDASTDKIKLSSGTAIQVGSAGDTSNFLAMSGLTASPDSLNGSNHERVATHRAGRVNTAGTLSGQSFSTPLSSTGDFTINGVHVTYDTSVDSLNDVVNRINTKVSNVVASYDSQTDKIVLVSKTTGSVGIERTDQSGNFLEATGLRDNTGNSHAAVTTGQNAKILVEGFNDGNPIYSTTNTVTSAIPGVTLTLKAADLNAQVAVSVTRTSSDLSTKVQAFVDKYNAAMSLITSRYTEKPIANATSQTAQRVGLLRGDPMLQDIKTKLSKMATTVVEGLPTDHNRLGNLGITISKTDYAKGQLSFDKTALDTAVNDNFQQTYNILFTDANGNGKVDSGESGVLPRMLDALTKMVDTTNRNVGTSVAPAGSLPLRNATLGRTYDDLQKRIDALSARLTAADKVRRAQFLAAEQAITNLKAAANSLGATTTA